MSDEDKSTALTQEQTIRVAAVREANYYFGFVHKPPANADPIGLSVILDHAQYVEQYIADGTLPSTRSADI